MPTPTYDLIASNVLSATASSVTFSSIPATYRDLVLVLNANKTSSGSNILLRLNGDTTSSYSQIYAFGSGASTGSGAISDTQFYFSLALNSANRNSIIANFLDYSTTNKHKTILTRGDEAGSYVEMQALRWANLSAINSITLSLSDFQPGNTFYLYGIVS